MHNDIRNHFQEQNTNHFTQFYNDKVKQILFTLKKKKEKKEPWKILMTQRRVIYLIKYFKSKTQKAN